MPRIADTELDVFPIRLGGNVFGWTAGERDSLQTDDLDLCYAHADDPDTPLEVSAR